MSEHMGVLAELFLAASDRKSLYLISPGGPWTTGRLDADGSVQFEVDRMLFGHGIDPGSDLFVPVPGMPPVQVAHSTSWRQAGPAVVVTYIAVAATPGEYVQDWWPAATPVTRKLLDVIGKPRPHGAARPPVRIRYADVLNHAFRHLEFLRQTDRPARDAMSPDLRGHLAELDPVLAGLYEGPLLDEDGHPTAPGWAA